MIFVGNCSVKCQILNLTVLIHIINLDIPLKGFSMLWYLKCSTISHERNDKIYIWMPPWLHHLKSSVFKFEIYMYVFFKYFLQKYVLILNLRGSSLRNSLLITDVTKGLNLTTLWPTASLFCHINKIHERIIDLTHQLCSFYCLCYTTLF